MENENIEEFEIDNEKLILLLAGVIVGAIITGFFIWATTL